MVEPGPRCVLVLRSFCPWAARSEAQTLLGLLLWPAARAVQHFPVAWTLRLTVLLDSPLWLFSALRQ
jgi:hypothetical protein